jgi:hypothetical protein
LSGIENTSPGTNWADNGIEPGPAKFGQTRMPPSKVRIRAKQSP